MAEKKAKTAQKRGPDHVKRLCVKCGTAVQVCYFTGYGPKGFFWVPEGKECRESGCPYPARTR